MTSPGHTLNGDLYVNMVPNLSPLQAVKISKAATEWLDDVAILVTTALLKIAWVSCEVGLLNLHFLVSICRGLGLEQAVGILVEGLVLEVSWVYAKARHTSTLTWQSIAKPVSPKPCQSYHKPKC